MNKLLIICLLLFSCVSTSQQNREGRRPTIEERTKTAENIEVKESPVHISKDSPAWKPFLFIGLTIVIGCFLSARHKYIKRTWCKFCSRLDKNQ